MIYLNQPCLSVYISSSGAFTTWAKDCLVAKLEISTIWPFLAKVCHLCSEVWTSLCAGSRVVGPLKFQLRKGRECRPKCTRLRPLPLTRRGPDPARFMGWEGVWDMRLTEPWVRLQLPAGEQGGGHSRGQATASSPAEFVWSPCLNLKLLLGAGVLGDGLITLSF